MLLYATLAQATELRKSIPANTESPPLTVKVSDVRTVIADVESEPADVLQGDRQTLDEVLCFREFAPLEPPQIPSLFPLDSGNVAYFWSKSEDCFQCVESEPIRIESVDFVVLRPDGSLADTIDFRIDVFCAVGADPCNGFGLSRGHRFVSYVFSDDPEDGAPEITVVNLAFDGLLTDSSGAFLAVASLGTRVGSTANLVSEESSPFVAEDCKVWLRSDTLSEWNEFWGPDHGAPMATIGWTCDLGDSLEIPPCPDSCTFARFSEPQVYFDPFSNTVYQWIEPALEDLPLQPADLSLRLYFETLGNATDRAYFRVLFACAGFESVCCPPSHPLCTIEANVERGTQFQTVLDVSVPLAESACCLSEPFWLGVVIDSVTGGASLPSFLYSAASVDPFPPQPCEQWTGNAGRLVTERTDDVAWADIRLSAQCKSCSELSPVACSPVVHSLDCGSAQFVACSEDGILVQGQEIFSGIGGTDRYCCSDLDFVGGELVYRMQVPNQGNLSIHAATDTAHHVALFLLETCDPRNCVLYGVDSLSAAGLINGEYFVVAESFDTTGIVFDLLFECIADCNHETCVDDVRGTTGIGNRYLDGEGDGQGNIFFQSYYPGTGTTQTILRYEAATCDSLPPLNWQSIENSPSRMLAFDPRNGGEFWCGTTIDYFSGTGRLYRLSSGGGVVQSWTSLPGLPIMRWSGAAFDPTHNHLWVMIRDSSNTGLSRAYEIDMNDPLNPVVIQGPHALPHQSPNQALSSAGADYAQFSNHLLVVHQGSPEDFVQCYEDLNPSYAGPRPGPGLAPVSWCSPDSNGLQGYGIAAIEDSSGGRIAMTNFTDADWVHPIEMYPPPCRLSPERCTSPTDLSIWSNGTISTLKWTAVYSGTYDIYSSDYPGNDGNPDNGLDNLFRLEATLDLVSGPAQWQDLNPGSEFKVYVIVLTCASRVE